MARQEKLITHKCFSIKENGSFRVVFGVSDGYQSFTAAWDAPELTAAGSIVFSFDGNAGDPPVVMNLASGNNAVRVNTRLPFVDVDVSGLPAGGGVILYFR